MNTIYTSDKTALALFARAFPSSNLRTIRLVEFHGPKRLDSYWSGGSRDYFEVIRISDGVTLKSIPQNGSGFDSGSLELSSLPEGFALAQFTHYGKHSHGALYLHEANITLMLPPAQTVETPWAEKAVLAVTCGLKSFARREEAERMGISPAEFATVTETLKSKGLVSKVGGITNEGRNLVSTFKSERFETLALEGGRNCRYVQDEARRLAWQVANNVAATLGI